MSAIQDFGKIIAELKIVVSDLVAEKEQIFESISVDQRLLSQEIEKLSNTNGRLESVSQEFSDTLESSAAKIVEQLKIAVLEELNKSKIADIDDITDDTNLGDSQTKVKQFPKQITKIDKKSIKMFFLGVVISSIISVACATYAASYMIQTFPTRVIIDKPENIILHDSEVGLWGTENTKVLKGLKKDNRKNSSKF